MKSITETTDVIQSKRLRAGVTLTEVLVSVVIMSIGVVLLSTLLPISILRTAQATQLTHAVFMRNNAEAAIESDPRILNNVQIPITKSVNLAIVDPIGVNIGLPNINGISRVNGGRNTMVYDKNGQRTALIDPLALRTTSVFDAAGRQTLRSFRIT